MERWENDQGFALRRMVFVVCIAASAWAQDAPLKNLVANPGFESPDPKNPERPARWQALARYDAGKPKGQPVLTYEQQGQEGRRSISVACPTGNEWGVWESEPFPVTPEKSYTLIFFYYCLPDARGSGRPDVTFNGKREYLDESPRAWTRHAFTDTGSAPTTKISLDLYYRKGQKACFDNFLVVPTERIVAPNLPSMGAIVEPGAVTFGWRPAETVAEYTLHLSKNKDFPPDQTQTIKITADSAGLAKPLESGSWFCQLRPGGPTGPGLALATGQVTFQWAPIPMRGNFTLLLSRDPTFPTEKTETVRASGSSRKLDKALASGAWFWKLRTDDAEGHPLMESPIQEFLVPPPLEFQAADTTPPVVNGLRPVPDASSVKPGATVSARLTDAGSGVDPATVRMLLDGADVSRAAKFSEGVVTLRPATPLAKGVHQVEVSVKDRAGNTSNVARWRFSVNEPMKTSVKIRPDRRCEINGAPFFPIGLQCYTHRKHLEEIANSGFNTILTGLPPSEVDNLNYLAAAGLKATCGIFAEIKEAPDAEVMLQKYFGKVVKAQHPALLSYWADEPKGKDLPAMKAIYEAVKPTDPNHPILWCIADPGFFSAYAEISDGLMPDPYPFWSNASFTQVSDWVDRAGKASRGKKPVWAIPEAFDSEVTGDRGSGRPVLPGHVFRPTPQEIRCMTYLAIVSGAMGIEYWASDSGKTGKCNIAEWPLDWAGLLQTASELRHLTPMLLGTDDVNVKSSPANQGILTLARRLDRRLYVIAVNSTPYSLAVQLQLPQDVRTNRVMVLFEDRAAPARDNAVTDIFRPNDVHVYEFNLFSTSP